MFVNLLSKLFLSCLLSLARCFRLSTILLLIWYVVSFRQDRTARRALQAIALVRELSPSFLDQAEQIIKDGTTNSIELFNVSMTGARVSSAVVVALKTLWSMKNAVFEARKEQIDVQAMSTHRDH